MRITQLIERDPVEPQNGLFPFGDIFDTSPDNLEYRGNEIIGVLLREPSAPPVVRKGSKVVLEKASETILRIH